MTKIDIISGFLGAGKTTLIKKLIQEAYVGEKVVLIENEFGEIGIDGGFLEEAGIQISEMNSGCICCSLVGDFSKALQKVCAEYNPERIIIEPSGVGKLSDVLKAVENAHLQETVVNAYTAVVDASKCKMYMKNFGEFFNDQVQTASCIVLSHVEKTSEEKLATALELLKEKNPTATFVTAEWTTLEGKTILEAMECKNTLHAELEHLVAEFDLSHDECDDPDCCCHHHEHHHDHDHEHCCHDHEHHHEHDHEHCCHDHEHHHDHGHEHCCHDHEHHHDHGHEHCCHDHEHHHHHAEEVFTSWGVETTRKYTKEELLEALKALEEEGYGTILRAKGIVAGEGSWLHFDYVPGEPDVREGKANVIGRLCVIGCKLREENLVKLFKL